MSKSPAFRFYPGDFMSSPDVQAMDLDEVGGYILLLCTAWQSERHGYLTDDDDKLRRWARMSREQWAQSRNTLLAKFPVTEEGWRSNPRMVLEAEKQVEYSRSRAENGRRGGRPSKHKVSEEKHSETTCGENESTGQSTEKPSVSASVSVEKPSCASKRGAGSTSSVKVIDSRHGPFRDAYLAYARRTTGTDTPPWDGHDGRILQAFLKKHTSLMPEQWQTILRHRSESEGVSHGEAFTRWVNRALEYLGGPLDRYGKVCAPQAIASQPVSALDKLNQQKGGNL